MGLAVRGRAGRKVALGALRRPATRSAARQRDGRAPRRDRLPTRRNPWQHNRRRRRLGPAQRAVPAAARSARAAVVDDDRGLTPARLRDRHLRRHAEPAHGSLDATAPRWPPTPNRPNRSTPATGCTTAGPPRSAGCPPSRTCTRTNSPSTPARPCGCTSPPPATPSTCPCTARCGWSPRRSGRSRPTSCRSCCRPADILESVVDS